MREKLIKRFSKALRGERCSKEAEVRYFGTSKCISVLGSYYGIITNFLISAIMWALLFFFVSCGSSKNVAHEKVNENVVSKLKTDSLVEKTQQKVSAITTETSDSLKKSNEEQRVDSEYKEEITITETTIFDTDTTPYGKQKVKQKIKQTKIERKCSSSNVKSKASSTEKSDSKTVSENEEKGTDKSSKQYANIENSSRESKTDKEQSVSESKQIYYIALTLFGIVLVIMVGVLAYWVFSKYRQHRKKSLAV